MSGRFSVEAVFKAVDKITAPVTRMQNRVQRMTRSMGRGFKKLNRTVTSVNASIKKGAMASVLALGLMGAAVANVTDAGAQFGRAIGSAASKFPEQIKRGTKAFRELEDAAREVGRTTEFTSVESAKGLNFLAKAGFKAKFSMKALAPIVDFATASEIDFATAADIASDALGAFALDSDNAKQKMSGLKRVMDVLGKTANSANVVVEELFETIKESAPVSVQTGQSIETYSAILGVLAKNGIKAGKAGTKTKNVMLSLAGLAFKSGKVFKELGIKVTDSSDRFRNQIDILEELKVKLSTLTPGDRLKKMKEIFELRGMGAAGILMGKLSGQTRILRDTLLEAGGSNKRVAAFIRNDVKGSLDSFTSAVESVKISIFSLNEGPLKDAIDNMTLWIRANEKMIAGKIGNFFLKLIENLDTIWTWIKRIGIALIVFQTFALVVKTLNGILLLTNLIMAANPIVLIVLGVIALIAAVVALVMWWGKLNKWVKIGIGLFLLFMGPIGWLILAAALIKDNWEPIKEFFVDLWGWVSKVTGKLTNSKFIKFFSKMGFRGAAPLALDAINTGVDGDRGEDGKSDFPNPKVVTPQERTAKSIEERRTTNTSEVTIKDETGRAEVTKGRLGAGLMLQPTGAF